jgi:hypothetical protein
MRRRLDPAEEEVGGGDPFADLFFTLAAMILLALVTVGPRLGGASGDAMKETLAAAVNSDASSVLNLYATRRGAYSSATPSDVTPANSVLDSASLRQAIVAAKAEKKNIAMIVDSDAIDTAFQLEALLGQLGVTIVAQARNAETISTRGVAP